MVRKLLKDSVIILQPPVNTTIMMWRDGVNTLEIYLYCNCLNLILQWILPFQWWKDLLWQYFFQCNHWTLVRLLSRSNKFWHSRYDDISSRVKNLQYKIRVTFFACLWKYRLLPIQTMEYQNWTLQTFSITFLPKSG